MTEKPKFCKDCKHLNVDLCLRTYKVRELGEDLVTGSLRFRVIGPFSAEGERYSPHCSACGPTAVFFTPK